MDGWMYHIPVRMKKEKGSHAPGILRMKRNETRKKEKEFKNQTLLSSLLITESQIH